MSKEKARQIIGLMQELHIKQKKKMSFYFRGEDAILVYLNQKTKSEKMSPSDISERLKVSSARVAASLNSLESKRLIKREMDSLDRRKINIHLTKEGKEKAIDLKSNHLNQFSSLLSALGSDDTDKLIEIIIKIKNILEEDESLC